MKKSSIIFFLLFLFVWHKDFSQCSSNINSLSSSLDTLCSSGSVDIAINGGNLGNSSYWELYTGSCGGTLIATTSSNIFSNITVNTTTTFYVKGDSCGISSCLNTQIFVKSIPVLDSISIDSTYDITDSLWQIQDTVCPQTQVTLYANYNHSISSDYSIVWHKNNCGASIIGLGDSIIIFPDSTTSYYARLIGPCGASLCKSVTIVTKDGSISPTGISASSNNFCTGVSLVYVAPSSPSFVKVIFMVKFPIAFVLIMFLTV